MVDSFCIYVLDPVSKFDLWILPLDGNRKPYRFLATSSDEWGGQFSPDGHWIAYVTNESGTKQVYLRPFPGPGPVIQVSVEGGSMVRWRRDGRELFYIGNDRSVTSVQVKQDTSIEISPPQKLFDSGILSGSPDVQYDVNADGQRFLLPRALEEKKAHPITIVLNWNLELKR